MVQLREYKIDEKEIAKYKYAVITTEHGDMNIKLFDNKPQTVANFISLVQENFYDNLIFHRVIPNFIIQAGCPIGDGTGNAGWYIISETQGQVNAHQRGAISMANAGKDTASSQFFICLKSEFRLDKDYTVFGQLIGESSFFVLDKIRLNDKIISIRVKENL